MMLQVVLSLFKERPYRPFFLCWLKQHHVLGFMAALPVSQFFVCLSLSSPLADHQTTRWPPAPGKIDCLRSEHQTGVKYVCFVQKSSSRFEILRH